MRPSRVFRQLLGVVLPAEDRDWQLAELDELYYARVHERGRARARRWYAREVLRFCVRVTLDAVRRRLDGRRPARVTTGRGIMMGTMLDDVRQGLRWLRRRPLVSLCVVAATSIGIGATTAAVSVIDAVLLRPLPYHDSERIVAMAVEQGDLRGMANPLDVVDWRTRARSFTALAAFGSYEVTLQLEQGPVRADVAEVSHGFDAVLGVRALHGRLFDAGDYGPGARPVVLSYEFWRDHLSSDPGWVGRAVQLDARPVTVIGILPPAPLTYPLTTRGVWMPLRLPEVNNTDLGRSGVWLRTIARLAPGVTLEQADAEMKGIAAQLRVEYPRSNRDRDVAVIPLRDVIVGPAREVVLLLAGAVALVLLIACANIGNLLLAQAQDRRREFAVRASIGAGSVRLARQLITESAMLGACGALLGVLLAPVLVQALLALYPGGLPRAAEVTLNGRVLLLALIATAGATLAAALPTLLQSRGLDLQQVLRMNERGGDARAQRRFRAALVVAQVALSVSLLVAGGLLGRTFLRLRQSDIGFASQDLLSFNIALSSTMYPSPEREAVFHDALLQRIRALPGVQAAGSSTLLPFARGDFIDGFQRQGHPEDQLPNLPGARLENITPGYHEALGLRLLQGLTFTGAERVDGARVVLVNEALVRRYFPAGAVGQRIQFRGHEREIVGVVSNKRHRDLRVAPEAEIYVPKAQSDYPRLLAWFVVRTQGDASALIPAIRRAVTELDPAVAIDQAITMQTRVEQSLAPDRFRTYCVGALALLALGLASLGLYAVITYNVSRQQREIGIRMALGENPFDTLLRVLRGALLLTTLGCALGLGMALASGRLLSQFVTHISLRDPLTLSAVPALFLLVTLAAAYGPARRASRVDPVITIRAD